MATTLSIDLLASNIFAYAVDLDDASVGKDILNYSLVCSHWAQCFINVKRIVSNQDVAEDMQYEQEAFWKLLFSTLHSRTEFEKHETFNYRELYMLNTIPTLDFENHEQTFIDGPSGNHQLFYSGSLNSCNLLSNSLKNLQIHKLVMRRVLRSSYKTFIKDGKILETMVEFFANRVVNREVPNQELTEFDVQYAKDVEERITQPFKKYLLSKESNPRIGDFIVSNGEKFIERFEYAVHYMKTGHKTWDDYYFFRMRKALYLLILSGKVDNLSIFDSALIIPRDFDGMEREMEEIPPQQYGIPFPTNMEEFKTFLDENCSIILENPFCSGYHGSVDCINFLICSKVKKSCGFYINIESTS